MAGSAIVIIIFWMYVVFGLRDKCTQPITYEIGTFDSKFGITKNEFIEDISEAENIWEKPVNRDLFSFKDGGSIKINLIYDERQASYDRLEKLGYKIDQTRSSYDDLRSDYDRAYTELKTSERELSSRIAEYESTKRSFDSEVSNWNSKGGAPIAIYNRLKEEETSLRSSLDQINQLRNEYNDLVDEVNALASALDRLASQLNLDVDRYNSQGSTGEEFDAGLYRKSSAGTEINIYFFDEKKDLIITLAHEFGHALGLEHLSNSDSIMYKLIQDAQSESLSPQDIVALRSICDIR